MIVRSKEYFEHHTINAEDVLKYGIKKACILGNIDKCAHLQEDQYHTAFPYMDKEEFWDLLQDLINENLLKIKI